ncbi:hypothetical protein ACWELJ_13040 [Nocardia sp. NPDC004582]
MRPAEPSDSTRPSPETVLAVGGWHPRHSRVLALAGNGEFAFALVDTNGDGSEIDLDELILDAGEWRAGMSVGAGEFIAVGSRGSVYVLGYGSNTSGVRWAYGRADRPGAAEVEVEGREITVTVADSGWWVWVDPVVESN